MRLDLYLVQSGIVRSRGRAAEAVRGGCVSVNGEICLKPSCDISPSDIVLASDNADLPYVGRGGCKLFSALKAFNIDMSGKICLDIGASTGGFTDCMLQNGAKFVYSLDVGHFQLHEKLRADKRVKCLEKTDIRQVAPSDFNPPPDFITADVSFISLKLILPKIKEFLGGGEAVLLIKPQFEAGRGFVGKNGLVKDIAVHRRVLEEIVMFCVNIDIKVKAIDFSPIKGGDGNIEYFMYITSPDSLY